MFGNGKYGSIWTNAMGGGFHLPKTWKKKISHSIKKTTEAHFLFLPGMHKEASSSWKLLVTNLGPLRGAHVGIKPTLKKTEGTEGKKVGFWSNHGNASPSFTSSPPQLLDVSVSKPINYVHFPSPFKTGFPLFCHQSIPNRHLSYQ